MFKFIFLTSLAISSLASAAQAKFVGSLEFTPHGCEANQLCTLKYDYGYIDPDGIGWVTKAGDKTDGASIPKWAQPFIGKPFDKHFIKAAVIHDHYCDRHVRPESQTHRAFYNALRENKVPLLKAKLMFYGVTVGAQHWTTLVPGIKCSVGQNCVQLVAPTPNLHGGKVEDLPNGEKLLVKEASYNQPGFDADMKQVEKILKTKKGPLSLAQIVALAKKRHAKDYFINVGDAVIFEDAKSKYPAQ